MIIPLTEKEIVELLHDLETPKISEKILTKIAVVLIKNNLNKKDIAYENLLKDINKNIDVYKTLSEKDLLEKIKPFIL